VFDHVTIRVSDREASERFYDLLLRTLGIARTYDGEDLAEWDEFSLVGGGPVTRRLHIGFAAASHAAVDAFWRTGVDAGHRSDGEPGLRPQYGEDYYGSFLLDPDGNSVEAVWYGDMRGGMIDHLWLRAADVEASARFYETVAGPAGFSEVRRHGPEHAQVVGARSTFSLVAGEPTEHVHMAFPGDDEAVEAFHQVATSAGYRDHGPPGERAEYHPGYYAAYVLDPGGHNVEVVNHRR
jgi:catechol 2,3-dioxygenase-like lactoylglutathione lyase family enzyme